MRPGWRRAGFLENQMWGRGWDENAERLLKSLNFTAEGAGYRLRS